MGVRQRVPAAGDDDEEKNGQRAHETEDGAKLSLARREGERGEADETRADGTLGEHGECEAEGEYESCPSAHAEGLHDGHLRAGDRRGERHVDAPVARLGQELRGGHQHERREGPHLGPSPGEAGEEDDHDDDAAEDDRRGAERPDRDLPTGEPRAARHEPVEERRFRGHHAAVPQRQDPVASVQHLARHQRLARLATLVDVAVDCTRAEHDGERTEGRDPEDEGARHRSRGGGQPLERHATSAPRRRRTRSTTWPETSTARMSSSAGVTRMRR